MDLEETQLDIEALESATSEIHYYSQLPKHIKGRVLEMRDIKSNSGTPQPAHVVDGAITVIGGKLNMPTLKYQRQFSNKTTSIFGIS